MHKDNDEIHRVLVSLAIEKALLDVGKLIYENVTDTLRKKYHCSIKDCYDNPQYLRQILDTLDKAGNVITVSLKKDLDGFRNLGKIEEFLLVMSR
ncbi:MAG: hypothetical protein LV477_10840 [Candidatus Nitrosotalea sp.]|nr:hypothetical protein [Candidatus Nitrosotalea sp.]